MTSHRAPEHGARLRGPHVVARDARRAWHRTPVGTLAAMLIGPAFFLILSLIPGAHGPRPVLTTQSTLYCPAPLELIWNPRTQVAYCETPNPQETEIPE